MSICSRWRCVTKSIYESVYLCLIRLCTVLAARTTSSPSSHACSLIFTIKNSRAPSSKFAMRRPWVSTAWRLYPSRPTTVLTSKKHFINCIWTNRLDPKLWAMLSYSITTYMGSIQVSRPSYSYFNGVLTVWLM